MRRQFLSTAAGLMTVGLILASQPSRAAEWNYPGTPGLQVGITLPPPPVPYSGSGGGSSGGGNTGTGGSNTGTGGSDTGAGGGDTGGGSGGASEGGGSSPPILGDEDHSFEEGNPLPPDSLPPPDGLPQQVPEPSGLLLLGGALLSYAGFGRRKQGLDKN